MPTATNDRAPVLDERHHLEGCPGARIERVSSMRPAKPDQGIAAKPMTVVRCIDCGGQKEEIEDA